MSFRGWLILLLLLAAAWGGYWLYANVPLYALVFIDVAGAFDKNVLWSRSYFAGTCGGTPLTVIKQYIEQQDRPH